MKFRREDGSFDFAKGFRAACRIYITAQEILVDHGSYPTEKIALELATSSGRWGWATRTSARSSWPRAGRMTPTRAAPWPAAITAIMHGQAYLTSSAPRRERRPVRGLRPEPRADAQGHGDAPIGSIESIDPKLRPGRPPGKRPATSGPSAWRTGRKHGYRNSQVTVLAPTGTIAFMMDCDTTGSRAGHRPGEVQAARRRRDAQARQPHRADGPEHPGLRRRGSCRGRPRFHRQAKDTIEGAHRGSRTPTSRSSTAPSSRRAGRGRSHWRGHVKMMSAVQPFLSGCDLQDDQHAQGIDGRRHPRGVPRRLARRPEGRGDLPRRLQGVAAGRARPVRGEGGRRTRLAAASRRAIGPGRGRGPQGRRGRSPWRPGPRRPAEAGHGPAPPPERLPDTRQSLTHKFDIQGHEGYLTVGFFSDGRPGELFVTMAKEGSTIGGLMDTIGTLVSMGLAIRGAALGVREQVRAPEVRARRASPRTPTSRSPRA